MKYNKQYKLRRKYCYNEFNYFFVKYLLHKFIKKKKFNFKKLIHIVILFFLKKETKFKIFLKNIKNVCILSGRSKSTYRKYKVSRIKLRTLSSNNLIPGFFKKTW